MTARTPKLIALIALVTILASAAIAQPPQLHAPKLQTHTIESKHVDQTFEIYVQVPWSKADGSERFPVMYLTDSYGGLAFRDTTQIMQVGGDVPRFISVGIGYELQSPVHAMEIRTRDLTPQAAPSGLPSLSLFFKDADPLELEKSSGGAADFLRFIREELQPFIDENYPTLPGERAYWGDSLGGLFGLYVLFNEPSMFNRYVIGSPSIWWADRAILKDAEAFIADNERLDAKVFMAVGALEETGDPQSVEAAMVTNLFQLETLLRKADLDGLELTTHLFPNETHTSVIGMNYSRGIQEVFDRPANNFIVEMLMGLQDSE